MFLRLGKKLGSLVSNFSVSVIASAVFLPIVTILSQFRFSLAWCHHADTCIVLFYYTGVRYYRVYRVQGIGWQTCTKLVVYQQRVYVEIVMLQENRLRGPDRITLRKLPFSSYSAATDTVAHEDLLAPIISFVPIDPSMPTCYETYSKDAGFCVHPVTPSLPRVKATQLFSAPFLSVVLAVIYSQRFPFYTRSRFVVQVWNQSFIIPHRTQYFAESWAAISILPTFCLVPVVFFAPHPSSDVVLLLLEHIKAVEFEGAQDWVDQSFSL